MPVSFDEFPKIDESQWKQFIQKTLPSDKAIEQLYYPLGDDKIIDPFYFSDTLEGLSINKTKVKSGVTIHVKSAPIANEIALGFLERGVESIVFYVEESIEISELLDGVVVDYIEILIVGELDIIDAMRGQYTHDNLHYLEANVNVVSNEQTTIQRLQAFKQYIEDNKSSNRVNYPFIIEIKNDFLVQIAELRSMRIIIDKIVVNKSESRKYKLIANCNIENMAISIHPMIPITYQMLSAAIGGSDWIIGVDASKDIELARLGCNCYELLKEESKLFYVNDPIKGSSIIENITQKLLESIL